MAIYIDYNCIDSMFDGIGEAINALNIEITDGISFEGLKIEGVIRETIFEPARNNIDAMRIKT